MANSMSRLDLEGHELAFLRWQAGEAQGFIEIKRSASITAVFEFLRKSGYIEEDGFLTDLGIAALLSPDARLLLESLMHCDDAPYELIGEGGLEVALLWAGCIASYGRPDLHIYETTDRGRAVARILADEGR